MINEQVADKKTVSRVVSKALIRAANDLGLSGSHLARTIGLSEATISRIRNGTFQIVPDSKSYEMALMVIRIHRA